MNVMPYLFGLVLKKSPEVQRNIEIIFGVGLGFWMEFVAGFFLLLFVFYCFM